MDAHERSAQQATAFGTDAAAAGSAAGHAAMFWIRLSNAARCFSSDALFYS